MDSSCFKIPTEGYQDSRHQLQALLTEQGLDGCLMQGHIYKGMTKTIGQTVYDIFGPNIGHSAASQIAALWLARFMDTCAAETLLADWSHR